MCNTFGTAAGMQPHSDLELAESRVFARGEAHVTGEDEFAAHAPEAAANFRDAHRRRLGETHERIHQDRKTGRPDGTHDISDLARQIKMRRIKVRNRAFEYDDTQARAGVHSCEQILQGLKYGRVHDVERRINEHYPPVSRRFYDDLNVLRRFSHDSDSLLPPIQRGDLFRSYALRKVNSSSRLAQKIFYFLIQILCDLQRVVAAIRC